MKRLYTLSFLFVFVLCSSVINTNRGVGEESSSETKNDVPSQVPDIFSQLFPIRDQIYPDYEPRNGMVRGISDAEHQYAAKMYLNERLLQYDICSMFAPNALPKNLSVICIPTTEIKGSRQLQWKCLLSFYLDETNVTVVKTGRVVALTFEYDENPDAPKKLEVVRQELSRLLPIMNHLVLDCNSPKNKEVYEGNEFDESKLYYAEANKEKVLDPMWVRSVRWWRGCGRFGISFDSMTPWEIGGGTHYDIRDTYGERL